MIPPNYFELFGYDVLIDQELQCWLIEVNSSPSLHREFLIDGIVKNTLIDDVLKIVNPLKFDHERLVKVIERRIKKINGFKSYVEVG